jgi:methionine-S-sulfoxide reductase
MRSHWHRAFLALLFGAAFMATPAHATSSPATAKALFGGGCFWCMQPAFDATDGVKTTLVGYAGGDAKTANYESVSRGNTGHVEVIEIEYDAAKVAYARLLQIYLENIDPTDGGGQFADRGSQYAPVIFYHNEAEKAEGQKALRAIAPKFAPAPIKVALREAMPFYVAEDYHQRYYQKNSAHYNAYKRGSGRADFIEKNWK